MTIDEQIEIKKKEIKELESLRNKQNKDIFTRWLLENGYEKNKNNDKYLKKIDGSIYKSEIRIHKNEVTHYYIGNNEERLDYYSDFDDISEYIKLIQESKPPKKYKIVKTYIYEDYFGDYDCAEAWARDTDQLTYNLFEWNLEEIDYVEKI